MAANRLFRDTILMTMVWHFSEQSLFYIHGTTMLVSWGWNLFSSSLVHLRLTFCKAHEISLEELWVWGRLGKQCAITVIFLQQNYLKKFSINETLFHILAICCVNKPQDNLSCLLRATWRFLKNCPLMFHEKKWTACGFRTAVIHK